MPKRNKRRNRQKNRSQSYYDDLTYIPHYINFSRDVSQTKRKQLPRGRMFIEKLLNLEELQNKTASEMLNYFFSRRMVVVVPLSALTDRTPNAAELLSGLITPTPALPFLSPPASCPGPYVNYYLCFLLIICSLEKLCKYQFHNIRKFE